MSEKEAVIVSSSDGHVSGSYSSIMLATIHTGLQQLEHFKKIGCSNQPDELDWEIKLYKYILAQPDPEKAARAYQDARYSDKKFRNKRAAVKILGWEIP